MIAGRLSGSVARRLVIFTMTRGFLLLPAAFLLLVLLIGTLHPPVNAVNDDEHEGDHDRDDSDDGDVHDTRLTAGGRHAMLG
jgi:hypothetical protein